MINNQNLAVLSEKVAHLESAVSKSTEASGISYDNTDSGLTAVDVQAAIDELSEVNIVNITVSSIVAEGYDIICYKVGKIVLLNIRTLMFNTLPGNTDAIIEGLPAPADNLTVALNEFGTGVCKRCRLLSNSLINLYSTFELEKNYFGLIVYVTD